MDYHAPWRLDRTLAEERQNYTLEPIYDARDQLVGHVAIGYKGTEEGEGTGLANARLICAAAAMLKICQMVDRGCTIADPCVSNALDDVFTALNPTTSPSTETKVSSCTFYRYLKP